MSWTVIEADGNGVRETRSGGTLTGAPVTRPAETESTVECSREDSKEPEAETKPKPGMVMWRLCVWIEKLEEVEGWFRVKWYPSGDIPENWYMLELQWHPVKTFKELPEGQKP